MDRNRLPPKSPEEKQARRGALSSLRIVGLGLAGPAHVTRETAGIIQAADRVTYLVADPLSREWLNDCRPDAVDLSLHYQEGRPRAETYRRIVEEVLRLAEPPGLTAAIFYGHPGVFSFPGHELVRSARRRGLDVRMLPAVSAEDCLFADLGIDPGARGCQSFEATDFLVRRRRFDPTSGLVLWQIGVIAIDDFRLGALWNPEGVVALSEELLRTYPAKHPAVIYEAATLPLCQPKIVETPIGGLPRAPVTALSTLWVEPMPDREVDMEMVRRLQREDGP